MNNTMYTYIHNQIIKLAEFTETPGRGISRLPFTRSADYCMKYLRDEMNRIGLETKTDGSGAVYGKMKGKSDNIIMSGSHYDSVMYGGAYDGIAGVVCAMAVADYFIKNGITPPVTFETAAFNDEEGARFAGGYFSSKAMLGIGDLSHSDSLTDCNGITMKEAMDSFGYNQSAYMSSKRDLSRIKGFFEIHIEQGPIMECANKKIGIVTDIVGIKRCLFNVYGCSNHAGTTPMNMRSDALLSASKMINSLNEISHEIGNNVATAAFARISPNEVNTIADKVQFSIDVRSPSKRIIDKIVDSFIKSAEKICHDTSTTYDYEETLGVPPAAMDKTFRKIIKENCEEKQVEYMEIVSGAGHDSLVIADYIPTAMIFVPSKNGRSHCPEEYTECSDLALAAEVLADTILKL